MVESVWKLIEGVTEAAQAGEEKMSSRRNQWFVLQVGEKFAQDALGAVFAGSQEEKTHENTVNSRDSVKLMKKCEFLHFTSYVNT